MTWFATGAAIASAVVTATAAISSAEAQKDAAEYNAKVQDIASRQKELEGREAVRRQREQAKTILARQLGQRAASGLDISAGSSLMVAAESAARMEVDALNIGRQSRLESQRLREGAQMSRFEGKQAQTAGYMQAGASLLSGASGVIRAQPPKG